MLLLRRVDALHAALGPEGVTLTKAGNPTLADGRRMVDEVGVPDDVAHLRSSADLRELFAVGQVAQLAGAVDVTGSRMRSVSGWTAQSPGDRWRKVVEGALSAGAATLRFGAVKPMPLQLAESADGAAFHFIAMLWMAEAPVPLTDFAEIFDEATFLTPRLDGLRSSAAISEPPSVATA